LDLNSSLYIHIPFCSSFCDYCDFYSVSVNNISEEYIDAYLFALIEDIKFQINYFNIENIPTVYIGGGTPSVLGKKIGILLKKLNSISQFSPFEFTIEANPESITKEFLDICKEGGVTRLSIGVQTLHNKSRMSVNRKGSDPILHNCLSLLSNVFNSSFSVDLMAGLPFQTEEVIINDIKRVLQYKPCHISLYSLTLEKETLLFKKIKNKKIILPDIDTSDTIWMIGQELLVKNEFEHYEISNFALDGKRSFHNMRYWQMQNWIGAGAAASGTIINEDEKCAKRYTYRNDIDLYIKNPNLNNAVFEEVDNKTLLKDTLLMGYRLKEGPDEELFNKRFDLTIEKCIPQSLKKWKNKNKILFLNKFLSDAFDELDLIRVNSC